MYSFECQVDCVDAEVVPETYGLSYLRAVLPGYWGAARQELSFWPSPRQVVELVPVHAMMPDFVLEGLSCRVVADGVEVGVATGQASFLDFALRSQSDGPYGDHRESGAWSPECDEGCYCHEDDGFGTVEESVLEVSVGADDSGMADIAGGDLGYCYLALFRPSQHGALREKLGPNPSLGSIRGMPESWRESKGVLEKLTVSKAMEHYHVSDSRGGVPAIELFTQGLRATVLGVDPDSLVLPEDYGQMSSQHFRRFSRHYLHLYFNASRDVLKQAQYRSTPLVVCRLGHEECADAADVQQGSCEFPPYDATIRHPVRVPRGATCLMLVPPRWVVSFGGSGQLDTGRRGAILLVDSGVVWFDKPVGHRQLYHCLLGTAWGEFGQHEMLWSRSTWESMMREHPLAEASVSLPPSLGYHFRGLHEDEVLPSDKVGILRAGQLISRKILSGGEQIFLGSDSGACILLGFGANLESFGGEGVFGLVGMAVGSECALAEFGAACRPGFSEIGRLVKRCAVP